MTKISKFKFLSLWPASTLAFTVFFFPVIKIELQNNSVFPLSFVHIFLLFLFASLILTLILWCIGLIGSEKSSKILTLAWISLATVAFIKGNLLNWSYGSFDGNQVDWSQFQFYGVIDIALCFITVLFVLTQSNWLMLNIKNLCSFILMAQLVNLVWLSPFLSPLTFDNFFAKDTVIYNTKTNEILSSRNNLFIFVLDTFPSDIFSELLENNSGLREKFSGFKYFPDVASVYPITNLSIPSMLTGINYNNELSYENYLYSAYRNPNSILKNLVDNGYFVEIDRWGDATPIPRLAELQSVGTFSNAPTLSSFVEIGLVGLYTVLPQFGKVFIHKKISDNLFSIDDSIYDSNLGFIRNISQLKLKIVDQPVAKIFHLKGPHIPLQSYGPYGFDYFAASEDVNAVPIDVQKTRENFIQVAEQSIRAVDAYFQKLKNHSVYDNATIIVLGDHGAGLQGQNIKLSSDWLVKSKADAVTGMMHASANPLLLVKKPFSHGAMLTSFAPVSLGDINCSVLLTLNIGSSSNCFSVFSSSLPSQRKRRFLYPVDPNLNSDNYFSSFLQFEINGPVWSKSSWEGSLTALAPFGVRRTFGTYQLGEPINFGLKGNSTSYLGTGWGIAENGFNWTVGKSSSIVLPVNPSAKEALVLEATLSPFVLPGKLDRQRLNVFVNGEKVAQWSAESSALFRAVIPARMTAGGSLELRFDLPDATSQSSMGINDNLTVLGVQMMTLKVSKNRDGN